MIGLAPMDERRCDKPLVVMISSTAHDLPEHRQCMIEACLRLDCMPKMMEQLNALDDDAVAVSLQMVDKADIYVGIFGHRYGFVPKGGKSITHLEYERAAIRSIPRLIFIMHADHPVKAADVETGPGASKLAKLKRRLEKERVVNYFRSPEELRSQVIASLATQMRKRLEAQQGMNAVADAGRQARRLHPQIGIPPAPEPYVAHRFTLLRTKSGLIGRRDELTRLTDWVARPETVRNARIFCMVALGGLGKSALAWHWFNEIAPKAFIGENSQEGSIWWSFYESDATYDNFVIRALAYVSGSAVDEVHRLPVCECEDHLLGELDRRPFVIILDGLERILNAYSTMRAAFIQDEEVTDAEQEQRLRQMPDPRADRFLRALATVRHSRILITTRLYPAALEGPTGQPIKGAYRFDLPGLNDDDALALWRSFGVSGTRNVMLPLFRTFENHALLIQALASRVARDRKTPRDFDAWWAANSKFDPFSLPMKQVKSHVLAVALDGLTEQELYLLRVLAAFRMPASYGTLCDLLIGYEDQQFADEGALIAALADLEDRGLLGWDNRPGANRYDLHPIVRGVAWTRLDTGTQSEILGRLQTHFEAIPKPYGMLGWRSVKSLEEITPAIELYDKLIRLGEYDVAWRVFSDFIDYATIFRLCTPRHRIEMLRPLFPNGTDKLPALTRCKHQRNLLRALAWSYQFGGYPGAAVRLFQRTISLSKNLGDGSHGMGLQDLVQSLRLTGMLRSAECSAREAFLIRRCNASLMWIGRVLATRGAVKEAKVALQRSLRMSAEFEDVVKSFLAELALWRGDFDAARSLANRAWEFAIGNRYGAEAHAIFAACLQGTAALFTGDSSDLAIADERLRYALTRARACVLVEVELASLIATAQLRHQQCEPGEARKLLDQVWQAAKDGPYPISHADALNVLADLERHAGNKEAAVKAATRAFELAWCDGPPYAYHWGLKAARNHLAELGAAEPHLPAFDESKFDPMPNVHV